MIIYDFTVCWAPCLHASFERWSRARQKFEMCAELPELRLYRAVVKYKQTQSATVPLRGVSVCLCVLRGEHRLVRVAGAVIKATLEVRGVFSGKLLKLGYKMGHFTILVWRIWVVQFFLAFWLRLGYGPHCLGCCVGLSIESCSLVGLPRDTMTSRRLDMVGSLTCDDLYSPCDHS